MKRKRLRKTLGWMTGAALAGLLVLAGCSASGGSAMTEEERPVAVQVAPAKRGALTTEEHLYGSLKPARETFVAPKLGGTLLRLEARENDRVEKGQRLAVIEHEQLEIQVRLNELAAEQALEQYRDLQMAGASQQQLDQAMRAIEQARLNLRLSKLNLENAYVTSPIAGKVAEVNAEEGDLVSSASPLFRIVDDGRMTAVVNVNARQRLLLQGMKEVRVAIPDLDLVKTAAITHVSAVPSGGFYAVEAELDNDDGAMVAGMSAYFVLEHVLAEEAMLVPTAAVVEKGGEASVFVVSGDRAQEIKVEVLGTRSDLTAVSGPLTEGSPVVTKGQLLLKDGTPVKIVGEGQ